MTEPTYHLRPDVAAQLDILLSALLVQVGLDDLETARERLREDLAAAWHLGWMAGHDDMAERRSPVTPNPYRRREL